MAAKRARAAAGAGTAEGGVSRLRAIQEYAASLDTEQLSTYYAQSKEHLRELAQRSKGEVLPHRAKAAEAKAALVEHMSAHGLQWVPAAGGGFLRLVAGTTAAPGTPANLAKAAAGLAAQPDAVARAVERAVAPTRGRPRPEDAAHLAAAAVVAGLLRPVPRLVQAEELPKRGAARAAAEVQCAAPLPAPVAGAVAAYVSHTASAARLAAGIAKHRAFHRAAMAECEPRLLEAVVAEPGGKWTRRLHLDGNVTRQYRLVAAEPAPPRVSRLAFKELPDVVAASVRRVAAANSRARSHLDAAADAAAEGNAAAAAAALQAFFRLAGEQVAEAAAEAAKAAMAEKAAGKAAAAAAAGGGQLRLSMRSSRLHHGRAGVPPPDEEEDEEEDEDNPEDDPEDGAPDDEWDNAA